MVQKQKKTQTSSGPKYRRSSERTGKVNAERLARSEGVIQKMTANYLEWVENDLDRLEQAVSQLEPGAENSMDVLEEIYRRSHDVKGQGGSFGFHLMTEIGGHVCRRIETLDQVTGSDVAYLSQCIKSMRQVIADRLTGEGGAEGKEILRGLAADP